MPNLCIVVRSGGTNMRNILTENIKEGAKTTRYSFDTLFEIFSKYFDTIR